MRLESTCKPRKGLGLFASVFAAQLSFQLSTLSPLEQTRATLFFLSILNVFFYKFGVKFPFPEVSVAIKSHFYAKLSNIS